MSNGIDQKIRKVRKTEKLKQKDLAEMLGVLEGAITRYELGTREPKLAIIQKLCAAFPQYTLYLMHEEMPLPRTEGQITPDEQELINQGLNQEQKKA